MTVLDRITLGLALVSLPHEKLGDWGNAVAIVALGLLVSAMVQIVGFFIGEASE